MNVNPKHSRPKNYGDLCDRLVRGETCEVRSEDVEYASIVLKDWLEFNAFTALPSDIAGWVRFVPYVEILPQARPVRSTCGVRSRDEEPEHYCEPSFPTAGCAVAVVVLTIVAFLLFLTWSHGMAWKGVAG